MRSISRTFSYSGARPSSLFMSDEMTGRATEFSREVAGDGAGNLSPARTAARVGTSAINQRDRLADMACHREWVREGSKQDQGRHCYPPWSACDARRVGDWRLPVVVAPTGIPVGHVGPEWVVRVIRPIVVRRPIASAIEAVVRPVPAAIPPAAPAIPDAPTPAVSVPAVTMPPVTMPGVSVPAVTPTPAPVVPGLGRRFVIQFRAGHSSGCGCGRRRRGGLHLDVTSFEFPVQLSRGEGRRQTQHSYQG